MPFKSKAQAKFMFAKHPEVAKEFAAATPSIKTLPAKVAPPSRSPFHAMPGMKEVAPGHHVGTLKMSKYARKR